ncbi:MAG: hypothetical protein OEM41_01085 [Ignavibacteria bacterium]|nr:hypothetical protein [Ignavibacteria bacterium]
MNKNCERAALLTRMAFTLLTYIGAASLHAQEENPIPLGQRLELFVDGYLIDTLTNARQILHHPHREGIALRFDRPWEGAFSAYPTVLKDGDIYRMYYRGLPGVSTDGESAAVTCYAESADGVTWTKPDLGIYQIMGTEENNVVLANDAPFASNFCPFIDTRPGVSDGKRYKALAGNAETGLVAFVSGDGIHWQKLRPEGVFTRGMFDSQNAAFWSDYELQYVCYFRTWTGEGYTGYRTISRTTSTDFLHWSDPVEMTFGDTQREHLYTNATQPYFRAPHIYISLPKRFFPEKAAFAPERAATLVVNPNYGVASSDAVFMTTRGGNRYDRSFMEAFIRRGPDPQDWVARDNTPALGVVPGTGREMFLYRMSHYAQETSHITRYVLRIDGFVSIQAPYEGGELLTRPLTFTGQTLEMNFSTSAAGGVRVEIQDVGGAPLPGYALEECEEMIGDEIERIVRWKGGSDVGGIAGKTIRLRIVMRDADLYALRFR